MPSRNTFAELKEKEREARRKIIIDAAERVFAHKPFQKVSMRDIAKEAGISPASIYRYFPDQQNLFVEAFLLGAGRLVQLIQSQLDQAPDEGVKGAAKVIIDFLTENDHYFRMMTHFMLDGELNDELLEKLNGMERSLIDQFDRVFKAINPEINVRLFSHAFFAALNGILITFRDYPGRSPEEVRKHMDRIGGIIAEIFQCAIQTKTLSDSA